MTEKDIDIVCEKIQQFAKRSKNITIEGISNYYICRIDLKATKKGKVYNEMVAYLNSVCPFYHRDNYGKYGFFDWFNSYDSDYPEINSGDYSIEVCITDL